MKGRTHTKWGHSLVCIRDLFVCWCTGSLDGRVLINRNKPPVWRRGVVVANKVHETIHGNLFADTRIRQSLGGRTRFVRMGCQGQTIETACVEQGDSVQERNISAVELEDISARTGLSLLVDSVVRDSGLAVDAGNLPLGAPRANRRPPITASFGLDAVVAVLLSRSQHASGYYRARHCVGSV